MPEDRPVREDLLVPVAPAEASPDREPEVLAPVRQPVRAVAVHPVVEREDLVDHNERSPVAVAAT